MSTLTNLRARRANREVEAEERSILSPVDRRQPGIRFGYRALSIVIFTGLVITGILPLLWLLKAALSTTQDLITDPFAWFPSGVQWHNIPDAWSRVNVGQYLWNTAVYAFGAAIATLIVTATLAYVISVLKPKWGPILTGAILATIFLPGIMSLVPLYLTVLNIPGFGFSLANTFWGVWLPAAASGFNVLVVKRFFDAIPREIIEAAQLDGVGPVRMFFIIVLPYARPILGVIAIFAVIGAWKDFLWPKLVLQDPNLQPLSVALPRVAATAELSLQMAAMFISIIIPIALFLVFQRQILAGVSLSGGTKG